MLAADFVFVGRPTPLRGCRRRTRRIARTIDLLRERIDGDIVLLGIDSQNAMAPELLNKEGWQSSLDRTT